MIPSGMRYSSVSTKHSFNCCGNTVGRGRSKLGKLMVPRRAETRSQLEGPTGLIRTGLPGCDSFGQGAGGVPIEG